MKKNIIYTNLDNQDFTLEIKDKSYGLTEYLQFTISNNCNYICLLNKEEIDEFCDLLQEYKKLMK